MKEKALHYKHHNEKKTKALKQDYKKKFTVLGTDLFKVQPGTELQPLKQIWQKADRIFWPFNTMYLALNLNYGTQLF